MTPRRVNSLLSSFFPLKVRVLSFIFSELGSISGNEGEGVNRSAAIESSVASINDLRILSIVLVLYCKSC